jgi:hypothetical protein
MFAAGRNHAGSGPEGRICTETRTVGWEWFVYRDCLITGGCFLILLPPVKTRSRRGWSYVVTIVIALLILWLLGLVASYTLEGLFTFCLSLPLPE